MTRDEPEAGATTSRTRARWVYAAIVAEGIFTLVAVLLMFPIGATLVVVNAVLAIVTRGVKRKLFAWYAIAGAAVCGLLSLLLLSGTFQ
jgi:hypothetical protein